MTRFFFMIKNAEYMVYEKLKAALTTEFAGNKSEPSKQNHSSMIYGALIAWSFMPLITSQSVFKKRQRMMRLCAYYGMPNPREFI
jgi:hypothetical protein